MRHKAAIFAVVCGLLATPVLAQPVSKTASGGSVSGQRLGDYELAAAPVSFNVSDSSAVAGFSPITLRALAADAVKVGDVPPGYITGPALTYQAPHHGPFMEVGVLGGGMDNMPFLAHVALDWHF